MTVPPPTVVVPERGTGLRRSAVIADPGGGFVWLRRAGEQAPVPLVTLPEPTAALVAAIRTPAGSRWTTGTRAGDWLGFPMPAPRSVWEELVTARPVPGDLTLETTFRECGRLLRALHDVPAPADGPRPPSLDRLMAWLAADNPQPAPAARARQALADTVGDDRWRLLQEWTRDLGRPGALVHGWFGLGHVARGEADTVRACVGDDAAAGDPALDVGFLLGQVRELEAFGRPAPDAALTRRLRAALVTGYGELPAQVDRAAAVQLALHVHDFAHYFAVVDHELPTWARLVAAAVEQAR